MKSLLRLRPYFGPHRREVVLVLVTMAVGTGVELLKPWPTKVLLDQVLGQSAIPPGFARLLALVPGADPRSALLVAVAVATVLIFVAATLLSTAQTIVAVRLGQRMVYELGGDLFRHLQRLSLTFHSRRPVGDTVARVTGDPYCVQHLVNGVLVPLLQAAATLVGMFVIMWHLQPTMTVLALGVAPFLALSIALFGRPMQQRNRERIDLEARMMASVEQTLTAIPAVQAFTREVLESRRFHRQAADTVGAYVRSTSAEMAFKLFVGLVTAIGTAALIWVGGRDALEGRVTAGTIVVFLSYLASLYGPLAAMTYSASTLALAAANAERVVEILDAPADVRESPTARDVALAGHVRYDDVTFGYEPGRPVLAHVSFDVARGQVIALVGPTGAGKTTLVNLLLRFFDPWSGRITIDGHDLRDLKLRGLRRQVAVVLQEPFIFPMTIAENIAYGRPDATRDQIEAAAVAANAAEFIERLPGRYDARVGERGLTLSGGEKQRLAIARAFVKDPPLLVLDEPTSALDARTEGRLLDALGRLMRGRTTFIIAHRLTTIRDADRILVLDRGRLVEQGTHAELLRENGLYADLCRQRPPRSSPAGQAVIPS